jgi:hypothetical protein
LLSYVVSQNPVDNIAFFPVDYDPARFWLRALVWADGSWFQVFHGNYRVNV